MSAQIEELSQLVGDLVELARDEPLPTVVETIDLAEAVDHAVERVRRRAPSLTFEVDVAPWVVRGEAGTLERAVTNLLDNALDFTPEGGALLSVQLTQNSSVQRSRPLGGGGTASLRYDSQAKTYAQMLLDLPVEVPQAWLEGNGSLLA